MGTENELDLEGQTEPPIRGLTSSARPSISIAPSASPTLAGTVVTDDSVAAAALLTPESAHVLPVPAVGALLNTDTE